MFYNAKYNLLQLKSGEIEYVRFGSGKRILVLLPGLGDSLRSLKGTALPLATMYRAFAKLYTVYIFSRRKNIPMGYSTRDMAHDQKEAMDILNIKNVDLVGVSMGGMIAQHFAAQYPDYVRKLVLVVTSAKTNPILTEAVEEWIRLAKANDHEAFMESNIRRIYSESYYNKHLRFIPIIAKLTKPKSYEAFHIQAKACLEHNSFNVLGKINCPSLVIGGEKDICLGCDASREIADNINKAELFIYPTLGHGLYEEAKDFIPRVFYFLAEEETNENNNFSC